VAFEELRRVCDCENASNSTLTRFAQCKRNQIGTDAASADIGIDGRASLSRGSIDYAFSLQGSQVIHRSGLTLKSEIGLNFATRRRKSGLLLLSPNEI